MTDSSDPIDLSHIMGSPKAEPSAPVQRPDVPRPKIETPPVQSSSQPEMTSQLNVRINAQALAKLNADIARTNKKKRIIVQEAILAYRA